MTLLANIAIWIGVLITIALCIFGSGVAASHVADSTGLPFTIVYFGGLVVTFGIFLGVLTTIGQ